ncbi:hypothetical protein BMY_0213 [Wohlfahrtiimonas chitiniclastica]|nr:hypothetical protein BMY_0213 [Wohlfahrtiimonas chitiniclastica]
MDKPVDNFNLWPAGRMVESGQVSVYKMIKTRNFGVFLC